jgi:SAM-dependent methyltransferase
MTTVAPFRPERFASAAEDYVAARPPYAPALIERLAREAGLGEASRVLDLGCGPGTLAIPLARYSGTVIGIDPSHEMIAAAARQSASLGVAVDWRVASSQELGPDFAPLDLVVMGRSFHWMDRGATLARLDELISPKGAIALLSTETLPFPEGRWAAVYDAIRAEFERADDFDGYRKSPQWEPHDAVLLASPFSRLEKFGVIEMRMASLGDLISRALSQSSTTPEALGARRPAFEQALRDGLIAARPDGQFPEIIESAALLARRPIAP